jgi:Chaperone of endosialidase
MVRFRTTPPAATIRPCFEALLNNTIGHKNTATGSAALASNKIGNNNTANGEAALFNNTIGNNNSATAVNALSNNTSGNNNTANGFEALLNNTTGNANTAYGFRALLNTTGSRNIGLGGGAGFSLTTGDNNIVIGNSGFAADSNRIRIGTPGTHTDTFIAGIRGATVQNGLPVVVGGQGKLGTLPSSVRFKEAIKPMDNASEAILALKPVTFRYKNQKNTTSQFGLVAEDVAKVNPDLVVRDENGEIYTVRYDAVNAMLLNEFLKEHRKVEQLEKQIEALTAGLQKVSDQLELRKPAPQVVNNP